MKPLPILLVALLLVGSVSAFRMDVTAPERLSTGQSGTVRLDLQAERNWSHQVVWLNITTDKTGLLKLCNGSYTDTFSIDNRAEKNLKIPVLYTRPGTYTLTVKMGNDRYNQTVTKTVKVTGLVTSVKPDCKPKTGNRDQYGLGQYSPVKNRIKNTVRRYAVW